jgi:hypothetical protein
MLLCMKLWLPQVQDLVDCDHRFWAQHLPSLSAQVTKVPSRVRVQAGGNLALSVLLASTCHALSVCTIPFLMQRWAHTLNIQSLSLNQSITWLAGLDFHASRKARE